MQALPSCFCGEGCDQKDESIHLTLPVHGRRMGPPLGATSLGEEAACLCLGALQPRERSGPARRGGRLAMLSPQGASAAFSRPLGLSLGFCGPHWEETLCLAWPALAQGQAETPLENQGLDTHRQV